MSTEDRLESWSKKVAELGVDRLIDHGLIKKEDFERATSIVAEEIFLRLTIHDYPPPEKTEPPSNDA
jgi:hypothetical protein